MTRVRTSAAVRDAIDHIRKTAEERANTLAYRITKSMAKRAPIRRIKQP